jgi:hypothetical protein
MIELTTASPATLSSIRQALGVPSNVKGTFSVSVSAPALSGTFYGDGSHLIGASLPGQANINTTVTNTSGHWNTAFNTATDYQSISGSFADNTAGTFSVSVSAPSLSGTFYGDGTNLTGVSLLSTQAYILSGNNILPVLGDNVVSNQYTDVAGGQGNTASGYASNVAGGQGNIASGDYSAILGGNNNNTNNQTYTFIIGQGITASQPNYTYVNNISSQGLISDANGNSNQWNHVYTNVSTLSSTYAAVTAVNGTIYQIQAVNNNGTVVLSIPSSFRTPGDLNVGGNLYVAGSSINLNSLTLSVSSPIIYINDSLSGQGNVYDIGLVGHFNNGLYQHTGLVRSAQNNYWSLFSGLTSEPLNTPTLNYSDPTFTIDTLRANILGSLSGNVVGDVSGNAGSVTNGVYTNGSYSDPSWLTTLADTKITGTNRNSWDKSFNISTTYQNVSSTFATNTTVQNTSSLLVLTSTLNSYQTSVAASTATLLPTTTYQNVSGTFVQSLTAASTSLGVVRNIVTLPVSAYAGLGSYDPYTVYILL